MSQVFNLSRLHWPVNALGPGRRVGIWFQGCSIGCVGCCSRDTWQATPGHAVRLEDVLHWIIERTAGSAEGYTISGGEPFDQPDALHALLLALRALPSGEAEPDILVYSGYPWRKLQHRHASILDCVDVVVSDPYVDGRSGDSLRGSSNQQIHLLTPLASDRYGPWLGQSDRQLQTHFDGETLRLIGIPRPGDLERIRQRLSSAGITLDECSWLA